MQAPSLAGGTVPPATAPQGFPGTSIPAVNINMAVNAVVHQMQPQVAAPTAGMQQMHQMQQMQHMQRMMQAAQYAMQVAAPMPTQADTRQQMPVDPTHCAVQSLTADEAASLGSVMASGKTEKKKVHLRKAAGHIWSDPTLDEWTENDHRVVCRAISKADRLPAYGNSFLGTQKKKEPDRVVRGFSCRGRVTEHLHRSRNGMKRVFCGDLGNEVTDEVLASAFRKYKSFDKARVVRDKRTGKTKGYGFVSFMDPNDMLKAIKEMNYKYVGNRPIRVLRSKWKDREIDSQRNKQISGIVMKVEKNDSKTLRKFKKLGVNINGGKAATIVPASVICGRCRTARNHEILASQAPKIRRNYVPPVAYGRMTYQYIKGAAPALPAPAPGTGASSHLLDDI